MTDLRCYSYQNIDVYNVHFTLYTMYICTFYIIKFFSLPFLISIHTFVFYRLKSVEDHMLTIDKYNIDVVSHKEF